MEYRYFQPEIETMDREQMRKLQGQKLHELVEWTYARVEHYRKKMDAIGVKPDDIQTIGDIAKLPFTTKADLRDTYPTGMFAVPNTEMERIHASSGTTGNPTVVGYTKGDIESWSESVAIFGFTGILWVWPFHRRVGATLWRRIFRRHGHPHVHGQHSKADSPDEGFRNDPSGLHALLRALPCGGH